MFKAVSPNYAFAVEDDFQKDQLIVSDYTNSVRAVIDRYDGSVKVVIDRYSGDGDLKSFTGHSANSEAVAWVVGKFLEIEAKRIIWEFKAEA